MQKWEYAAYLVIWVEPDHPSESVVEMKTLLTLFFSLSLLVTGCANTNDTVTRTVPTLVVDSASWMGGFVVNRHLE